MKVILSNSQISEIAKSIKKHEHDIRAKETNPNPTEKQKKAGNYKMAHVKVMGFQITIENPIGTKRYWTKKNGQAGFTVMKNHYGYFSKTVGKDGDAVDVFLGPDTDNVEKIYVVDQYQGGKFDESKVMLGFSSIEAAKKAYFDNFDKDWKGFKCITGVPIKIFKDWLYRGRKQIKEFRQYAIIRENKIKA